MFVRRALVATAALALLAGGVVATPAAAVDDKAELTLDAQFTKALKKGGVKTSALKPATFSGKAFTFPASLDGDMIMLSGGMMMKSGKNFVKVTRMVVNADAGTIDAEVAIANPGGGPSVGSPVTGLMRISGGTNQLAESGTWTGAKVALAKSVKLNGNKMNPAELLGGQLGITLKTGATLGTMSITVTP